MFPNIHFQLKFKVRPIEKTCLIKFVWVVFPLFLLLFIKGTYHFMLKQLATFASVNGKFLFVFQGKGELTIYLEVKVIIPNFHKL